MCEVKLTTSDYYSTMPWEWSQLERVSPEDLRYGAQCLEDDNQLCVSTEAPSEHAFNSMLYLAKRNGYADQVTYLYDIFEYNKDRLFEDYCLLEDGIIKVHSVFEVHNVYVNASAHFLNIISSGRHLVERMEMTLKKLYGVSSENYKSWKQCCNSIYDTSLSYALCDSLRNVALHQAFMLSVVNYYPEDETVGIALNIETGLLANRDLKGKLRTRIRNFRDERLESGLKPWLSVGRIVNSYAKSLSSLFLSYQYTLWADMVAHPYSMDDVEELNDYNVVILGQEKYSDLYSSTRSYRIVNSVDIQMRLNTMIRMIDYVRGYDPEVADRLEETIAPGWEYRPRACHRESD